jgi:hypothetical protein
VSLWKNLLLDVALLFGTVMFVLWVVDRRARHRALRALTDTPTEALVARLHTMLADHTLSETHRSTLQSLLSRGAYHEMLAHHARERAWYVGPIGSTPKGDMAHISEATRKNQEFEVTLAALATRNRT